MTKRNKKKIGKLLSRSNVVYVGTNRHFRSINGRRCPVGLLLDSKHYDAVSMDNFACHVRNTASLFGRLDDLEGIGVPMQFLSMSCSIAR